MMQPRHAKALIAGAAILALAGCDANPTGKNRVFVENPPPTLPVSINAMMVGMVDDSADMLWAVGNGDLPRDEHDWYLVRNSAYQTIIGSKAMQLAGTGPNDVDWVADPEWQRLSDELSAIGMEALSLAEAQQVEGWDALGDRLVQNCLACHEQFKPEIPSEGILHESTERESRGISIFD